MSRRLEDRLNIALQKFADTKKDKTIVKVNDPDEPFLSKDYEIFYKMTVLGKNQHFVAALKKKNGRPIEPVYLVTWSTPEGNLYEEFCDYLKNEGEILFLERKKK
jgi:hypothetical protein